MVSIPAESPTPASGSHSVEPMSLPDSANVQLPNSPHPTMVSPPSSTSSFDARVPSSQSSGLPSDSVLAPTLDPAVVAVSSALTSAAIPHVAAPVAPSPIPAVLGMGINVSVNNPAAVDDGIAAQVEWYLSRSNLPMDDFLKSHMDADLWVSLDLILTFPRMVLLGAQDKKRVAHLLHARSADIEVDLNTYRIRPAWALRSHLLIRGVPQTATEADLAAILRIPYIVPPAPDTAVNSPPSAPPSPTSKAPHFRGLMTVMQVSMSGEWVAVFAAREDAAAALPHVDRRTVCGQPVSAEVFIEGLEPHTVPAPPAVYQSVPSYYSHANHTNQQQLQQGPLNSHHQLSGNITSSSIADSSQPPGFGPMGYMHNQVQVYPQAYGSYPHRSGRRTRATSENGDDMRNDHSTQGYAHVHRVNGHRTMGHRRGGGGTLLSSNGGHTNLSRATESASANEDRSRSPSVVSSRSGAASTRRPRRTPRRPTRRGSPNGFHGTHNVGVNGNQYSHGHQQFYQGYDASATQEYHHSQTSTTVHAGMNELGDEPVRPMLNLNSGAGSNGLPETAALPHTGHFHPNARRSSLSIPASVSESLGSGGADVAAMDFPPLQPSSAQVTRTPSASGRNKRFDSVEATSGSAESVGVSEGKSLDEVGLNDVVQGGSVSDHTTESVIEVNSAGSDYDSLANSHEGSQRKDCGGNLVGNGFDSHSSSSAASQCHRDSKDERVIKLFGVDDVKARKEETAAYITSEESGEKINNHGGNVFKRSLTSEGRTGNERASDISEVSSDSPKMNMGMSAYLKSPSKTQAKSSGTEAFNYSGNPKKNAWASTGGTGAKSYAAILLSPPRTHIASKDVGKHGVSARPGAKAKTNVVNADAPTSKGGVTVGSTRGSNGVANGNDKVQNTKVTGMVNRSGRGDASVKGNRCDSNDGNSLAHGPRATPEGGIDESQQAKAVRRPPRSPSIWASKPLSVVKAGPGVATFQSTGQGNSLVKNFRDNGVDGNLSGSGYADRVRGGKNGMSGGAFSKFSGNNAGSSNGPYGGRNLSRQPSDPSSNSAQSQGRGHAPPQVRTQGSTRSATSQTRVVVG